MAEIRLENISKTFNEDCVVKNISLTIKDGSFTVLVGPSGCGKSTILRMLAGFEQQTEGNIWIDGKLVNDLAPSKRDIAMVFQNYALYPTMTVRGNIEFGLANRKVPKIERQQLVDEIAGIVGLTDHLNKKPDKLSGGQRQRVALARAMVKKPKVFILDEPLSNLDAKLRTQMRTELIELHERLGTTFVYVTHDQVEAMSMGDEIIILNKGEVQQKAAPIEVYQNPGNVFAAEFIGQPPMNVFGRDAFESVLEEVPEGVSSIGFRPEHAELALETRNVPHMAELESEIVTLETLGAETVYKVKNRIGMMNIRSFSTPIPSRGTCYVSIPLEKLHPFAADGSAVPDTDLSANKEAVLHGVR
ncbi:ABC transporter ATP-binding protein [Planomicrobium sp. YIM 101495]|uniref:ABC transporter ATP-binding protein n=1 Tax=Planomicrobium sp. YIM 101495 TaxID=2665160 RepID=UPI0012B7CD11|nr:ABC transporter ATP-binding protein [Planomicrobium sp. YIM 101495]MTD31706.1 ATP-binding cassette domain-containing protein [Planomicrobium sp. YIM 101495]